MNNNGFKNHNSSTEELSRLTLNQMGHQGDTLSVLDGVEVNVFGGIPGEEVIAKIFRYKRRKKSFTSGIVTEVLKPSPYRVKAPCQYFGACTGCQWQHIEYSHQLTLKRNAVKKELDKFDTLSDLTVSKTLPSPQQFNYRNHARFTIRQTDSLGYVNRITRKFVKIEECMLMANQINETLNYLQGKCGETSQLSVRYGINTSDWLIQPTLKNTDITLKTGQSYYHEKLLDKTFRISSPSFFQVNTKQAEHLSILMRKRLQLTGNETIVDAFAGVGTFAVLMAPYVKQVIAIEESDAAIKDAAINTLGIQNLDFHKCKTEDFLKSMDKPPDAIILDPPRVGCLPETLEAIIKWSPKKTIYVSCDPESLARDLKILVDGGLQVEKIEPIDMFPQTHHVECLVTIKSRE